MPRRCTLSLHLRGRAGALLLAAARLSRHAAGELHADIRREYVTEKSCAPHCTVSCVHQVSIFDSWRAPQHPAPAIPEASTANELVQIK